MSVNNNELHKPDDCKNNSNNDKQALSNSQNAIKGSLNSSANGSVTEVITTLAPLAWVAFGGPQAHLALLHEQVIERRNWLDSRAFTELFALCSILPGPTALQTVVGLGIIRAGIAGGICSLIVWSFPAVVIMIGFAITAGFINPVILDSLLIGVRPAAVGLVAVAAWKLGKRVVNNTFTFIMLGFGAVVCILYPAPLTFPLVLLSAALLALIFAETPGGKTEEDNVVEVNVSISKRLGGVSLVLFLVLLIGLTVSMSAIRTPRVAGENQFAVNNNSLPYVVLSVGECFYRNSSLIFGGGQVLLPLLQTECVEINHWVTPEQFGNGLGIMQSSPGPLFSFSGYIGAMVPLTIDENVNNEFMVIKQIGFGLLAVTAILLPAFLLLAGVLPFWIHMRKWASIRNALIGVNACAVGLVAAAVWLLGKDYVNNPVDTVVMVLAFVLIIRCKVPAPAVILVCGVVGAAATRLLF